jgi:hypothetical protein
MNIMKNLQHTKFPLQHRIAFSELVELRVDTSLLSGGINLLSQEYRYVSVALHKLLPQARHLGTVGFLQLCVLKFKIIALLSTTITEMALCNSVLCLPFVRRVVLVSHRLAAGFWSGLECDFSAEWAVVHG